MRVLVLGASGMLGHKVASRLSGRHEVWTTTREPMALLSDLGLAPERNVLVADLAGPDGESAIRRVVDEVEPDVVVNCVGLVKQLEGSQDPIRAIRINSLMPHLVAAACRRRDSWVLTVSTDCVFAGDRGHYKEASNPDASDLYGRSKLLGELGAPDLTLRTSIIGRQLSGASGLVEWFLSHRGLDGSVPGYSRAVFSGLPTVVLSDIIGDLLEMDTTPRGLFHVSSAPIDKLSLLRLLNEAFEAGIELVPDATLRIDRSLDSAAFHSATAITVPGWPELVERLAADARETDYDGLRSRATRQLRGLS